MPMFRVSFTCPTSIQGECDIEADDLDKAHEEAEDKVVAIIDAYARALTAYHAIDYLERSKIKPPRDPVTWDPTDCEVNADTDQIDVSEVEEL
jgi:hypothetical protein